MKKLPIGLMSMAAILLALTSAFIVIPFGTTTHQWYRNLNCNSRPTPAQIVANGSPLVFADVSGTPSSNFSDGSSTFTPAQFNDYVVIVCEQIVPNPICLMLVKRIEGSLQSTPVIVIDGCYRPQP